MAGGSVLLGMFVGERIAGGCSLNVRADAAGVLEIGYWLHPAFRGHGLATRAAGLLTEAALVLPDVRRASGRITATKSLEVHDEIVALRQSSQT